MDVPEGERPAEDSQARGTSNEAGEQTEDDASTALWGGGLRWGTVRPRCLLAMLCMMRAASFLAHNRKQSTPRDAGMLWLRLTFAGRPGRALRPDGRATMDSHGATGTACESATPTDRKLRNCCYGRHGVAGPPGKTPDRHHSDCSDHTGK